MGGTDSIDQKNSYYGNLKRGQKLTGRTLHQLVCNVTENLLSTLITVFSA